MSAFDVQQLQLEVGPWQRKRWPATATQERTALKVCEEAGELAGAVIKLAEGRRAPQDVRNEIGDVLISLAACADLHGFDLGDCARERWAEVRER